MREKVKTSPIVTHLEWGRIEAGQMSFKDAKLFPGGGREWDWNATGTRHVPGIQVADAEELIDRGAEVIVLSRGMDQVLQVQAETIKALERRGIEVVVEESRRAVERYNELARAGRFAGALIHSTC